VYFEIKKIYLINQYIIFFNNNFEKNNLIANNIERVVKLSEVSGI